MLWSNEDNLRYHATAGNAPAWLPPEHHARWHRLRQARLLFDGRHREYYLVERRTAYGFSPLRDGEQVFYRPYNLLGLIARKIGDLLFGEQARLYSDEAGAQDVLDAVADRSWLPAVLIAAAIDCAWAGDTCLEIVRDAAGDAYVAEVPPDEVYPAGIRGVDRQYAAYVRYATHNAGTDREPVRLVLETRYSAGLIERTLRRVDRDGVGRPAPIAEWPEPVAEREATGLSRPSIVYVPNESRGQSDFDGLIELQDDLNAKHTQIGRVLAKHADPRLAAPVAAGDAQGNLPAAAEVFFFRSKDEIPAYITWDAELAAAMEDRRFALSSLATTAEMPLSLLGIKDDAAVDSARKMRLASANALAKAQRKSVVWQQAIRLAMALAVEADRGFAPREPIGVEMRDGLPDDELDRAQVIATLRSASLLSRRRGLRMQWLDEASVEDELAELDAEDAQRIPTSLFGEPPPPPPIDNEMEAA